jgi:hypothetical protein
VQNCSGVSRSSGVAAVGASRGRKGRYEQMARISGEFVQGGIELPNRRGLNLLS